MFPRFHQHLLGFSDSEIDQARDRATLRAKDDGITLLPDPIPIYGMPYDLEPAFENLVPTGLGFMSLDHRHMPGFLIRTYQMDQGFQTGGVQSLRKFPLFSRILRKLPPHHTFREISIPRWHIAMFEQVEAEIFINGDGASMSLEQATAKMQAARTPWRASSQTPHNRAS